MGKHLCILMLPGVLVQVVGAQPCTLEEEAQEAGQNFPGAFMWMMLTER